MEVVTDRWSPFGRGGRLLSENRPQTSKKIPINELFFFGPNQT